MHATVHRLSTPGLLSKLAQLISSKYRAPEAKQMRATFDITTRSKQHRPICCIVSAAQITKEILFLKRIIFCHPHLKWLCLSAVQVIVVREFITAVKVVGLLVLRCYCF